MKDLKRNFSNQELLLDQLRDALQSNTRKESGDYASRLAQMRSARRSAPGVAGGSGRPGDLEERGGGAGRMQILRKQLDETKVITSS